MEIGGDPSHRPLRMAIMIVGLAAVYVGPMTVGANPVGALFFLLLGALPFVGYVGWIRTRSGSWAVGVTLLGNVLFTQVYVMERTEAGSSTAGLGYLGLLIYGLLILGLGAALDAFLRSREQG